MSKILFTGGICSECYRGYHVTCLSPDCKCDDPDHQEAEVQATGITMLTASEVDSITNREESDSEL
jgi:hypothetical protein